MKKLIASIFAGAALVFGTAVMAQDAVPAAEGQNEAVTEEVAQDEAAAGADVVLTAGEEKVVHKSFHQALKEKFIQGGAGWMTPILIVLILGLALAFERIIYLNLATTDTQKLLDKVEAALQNGGIPAAKEVCRNTRGPVASIFYQGLERADGGVEMIERTITSYGGVQMSRLESNMAWIALVIALAPSLGFLGTVVGMVQAFDDIEAAGDISPTVVAGGMKVALLTTVFGLIVAIIMQVFYNYLTTKIDSIVRNMEDSSISFMDLIVKHNQSK